MEGSQEATWMRPLCPEGKKSLVVRTEAVPGCTVSGPANGVCHILFIDTDSPGVWKLVRAALG